MGMKLKTNTHSYAVAALAIGALGLPVLGNATTPPPPPALYHLEEVENIKHENCDKYEDCVILGLRLGEGSRERALKRIQRLATNQGLVVKVVSNDQKRPTSRLRIQVGGAKMKTALFEKRFSRRLR